MQEIDQLLQTLKRELKARGMTYRDLARRLRVSEPSIKRLFSTRRVTLERLVDITRILGLTLAELAARSAAATPRIHELERQQEAELVGDRKLLVVTVCALNHWSIDDILAEFRISKAECIRALARLDRLGLIDLLPGNRIRIKVARDFRWLPSGPIRMFFEAEAKGEFLDHPFAGEFESSDFAHAMLSASAQAQMDAELKRVRQRLAALHEDSLAAPFSERFAVGLFLALRRWEPQVFKGLRRKLPAEQAAEAPKTKGRGP